MKERFLVRKPGLITLLGMLLLGPAFFAGGGVKGGNVVGASDKVAAYPAESPQKPENMAATIYHALGIPPTAAWYDELDRPHHIYHGQPIPGLT